MSPSSLVWILESMLFKKIHSKTACNPFQFQEGHHAWHQLLFPWNGMINHIPADPENVEVEDGHDLT